MRSRPGITVAVVAVMVVVTGGVAVAANLTLLQPERDRSAVGQLDAVVARATFDQSAVASATADRDADTSGSSASRDIALAAAADAVGGTFVSLEWSTENGRSVFEVTQMVDDGRLVEVYVEAATGAVLEIEYDDQDYPLPVSPVTSPELPEPIDAIRATEIAFAEVGGRLIEVDRTRRDGRLLFEVEMRQPDGQQVEVYIDAVTGDVLRVERERDDETDEWPDGDDDDRVEQQAWDSAVNPISVERAVAFAQAAVPGATLVEVEQSAYQGRPIWEVYLRSGTVVTEVYVDAVSGQVLQVDIDD